MSLTEITAQGTLKPDGTLELDQTLSLPPGRVQVTVKPMTATPTGSRGLVEVMDEIGQSQRARGYPGPTPQEVQAKDRARQQEDEEYEQRHPLVGLHRHPHGSAAVTDPTHRPPA